MTDADTTHWREPTTQKYLEAKASLPEDLHPHFAWAVQWYNFYAWQFHHTWAISYVVLAAMVKEGFRYRPVA